MNRAKWRSLNLWDRIISSNVLNLRKTWKVNMHTHTHMYTCLVNSDWEIIALFWARWSPGRHGKWNHTGEGNGTPLQYSCLENPMDGGAWWATVHGVAKSQTRLSNFPFTFHVHALEKEMENHSSVLAWRIPGTGEPDGLPSVGSHRVGHDWSHLAAVAAVFSNVVAHL